jgi:hypothetical protein
MARHPSQRHHPPSAVDRGVAERAHLVAGDAAHRDDALTTHDETIDARIVLSLVTRDALLGAVRDALDDLGRRT